MMYVKLRQLLEIEYTLSLRQHAYFLLRARDRFQLPPAASLVSLATHFMQRTPAKGISFNENLNAHTPVIMRSTSTITALDISVALVVSVQYTVEAAPLYYCNTEIRTSY